MTDEVADARSPAWRLAIPALVAIGLLVAGRLTPLGAWAAGLAESMRSTGAPGVALFAVAYLGATLVAMPVSLLTAAAGFAYGPLVGAAITLPVSVGGATLAFLLGRSLLRRRMEAALARSPRLRALAGHGAEHRGFSLVLSMRLAMIFPFGVLNFVLGATKLSARDFFLASLVGCVPSTLFYAYLGSLASSTGELGRPRAPGWLVACAVVLGCAALLALVRIALRELAVAGATKPVTSPDRTPSPPVDSRTGA